MSPNRDWSTIRHFKREEFIKNPDLVSWDTVQLMDEMRSAVNKEVVIHVAWDDSGHVFDSGHYTLTREYATAVDYHVVGLSLLDQWLFAERFPWSGIGIYPFWNQPGIHVDLRLIGREHSHLGRRWWRDADGVYQPLSKDLFKIILAMPVPAPLIT